MASVSWRVSRVIGVIALLTWSVIAPADDCSVAVDVGHFLERPGATSARGRTEFELKTAPQPAVLFEAGVLVNRNEELMLQRPDVRERIAVALSDAIVACLRDQ